MQKAKHICKTARRHLNSFSYGGSCGVTIALSRADLVASQIANDCVGITTQKDDVAK